MLSMFLFQFQQHLTYIYTHFEAKGEILFNDSKDLSVTPFLRNGIVNIEIKPQVRSSLLDPTVHQQPSQKDLAELGVKKTWLNWVTQIFAS